jgi:hypothetical protein
MVFAAPIVLIATLATVPVSGTPAPPSTPPTLKEIGRVRASAACGNIVVHANSAIFSTLRNDATLSLAINRLRNLDLEASSLNLQKGIHELGRLADQLRDDANRGVAEIKRLRDLADRSSDPARKAELTEFTDALGGALYRQKKISMDLSGFVAYLQYHGMETADASQAKPDEAQTADYASSDGSPPPYYQTPARHQTPNELAANAATDFADRMQSIGADEERASDHAEGAVTGC